MGGDRRLRILLRYALLVLAAAAVLFPVYMTVVDALLRPDQITSRPPAIFPTDPQWHSFVTAWNAGHLSEYLRNSAIVTVAITLAQLVTSILGGYAFAMVRFPGRRLLFGLCIATLMIPAEVTLIPNHDTIAAFGWLNTFPALIVPFVASGLGIFLFRQAFAGIPRDLSDAASLDGYGHIRFMIRVAVPISRPMIAAFAVFSFLSAWGQYLWPLVVTQTDSVRTVQIGLHQLQTFPLGQANVIFAGTVLAALPILVLLLAFQRQLIRGLTAGAIKG